MSGFYKFPAIALPDGNSRLDQLGKLIEEMDEVEKAQRVLTLADSLCDQDERDEHERCRKAYGMELMDVIHTAETALRMEFEDEEVDGLRKAVVEKNRARVYYGKDCQ